jgi:hypothetical protein
MTPVFLTRRELAARWRIRESTLANWAWQQQGPTPTKICGAVRYDLAAVEEFEKASAKGKRSAKRKGR